jgi:hypothetical protein
LKEGSDRNATHEQYDLGVLWHLPSVDPRQVKHYFKVQEVSVNYGALWHLVLRNTAFFES